MFDVGKHNLKNDWVLTVSEYKGSYKISKPSVFGIWANRTTGGQFGDGIWTINILFSVEVEEKDEYIPVSGGFDIETCYTIIAKMEELMLKYNIEDYSVQNLIKPKKIKKSIFNIFKNLSVYK